MKIKNLTVDGKQYEFYAPDSFDRGIDINGNNIRLHCDLNNITAAGKKVKDSIYDIAYTTATNNCASKGDVSAMKSQVSDLDYKLSTLDANMNEVIDYITTEAPNVSYGIKSDVDVLRKQIEECLAFVDEMKGRGLTKLGYVYPDFRRYRKMNLKTKKMNKVELKTILER